MVEQKDLENAVCAARHELADLLAAFTSSLRTLAASADPAADLSKGSAKPPASGSTATKSAVPSPPVTKGVNISSTFSDGAAVPAPTTSSTAAGAEPADAPSKEPALPQADGSATGEMAGRLVRLRERVRAAVEASMARRAAVADMDGRAEVAEVARLERKRDALRRTVATENRQLKEVIDLVRELQRDVISFTGNANLMDADGRTEVENGETAPGDVVPA